MDNENNFNASVNEETENKNAFEGVTDSETDGRESTSDGGKKHRDTKWFIMVFVSMLCVFMLPIIAVAVIVFALPPVYNDTFIGELGDKYELLKETDEPKIVIIGGSSVAFGIDSALMEEKLGMKVVNFGLYANLGTKLMLDLSRANINEDDIIIIAPEMSTQTLSLYFNSETAMQAIDGNPSMLRYIDKDNYEALVGASWRLAYEKLNYLVSGKRPENSGAYKKEYFNKYGDNVFDRPYNEMTTTTNVIDLSFRTDYTDGKETEYEEYIDYINDYIRFASRKGATVYYSVCPMNEAALGEKNNEDVIYGYYRNLVNSVNCKVISNVNDYIMDEGYFYDTEFHLNNAGVTVRTVKLIDDIKRERSIYTVTVPKNELPAAPGFKPSEIKGEDSGENLYFVLEETDRYGEKYYKVVGLTEEGKKQSSLTIPDIVNGLPVREIAANAFNGCDALTELRLGKNITAIQGKALNGAMSLKSLIIPDGIEPESSITVPNQNAAALITDDACCPELKIYVDEEYYESTIIGYLWATYSRYIVKK